tara:strand:+ start:3283 stop:3432 length:150 start_codon:yes stop_codon:yes gene_type:complete
MKKEEEKGASPNHNPTMCQNILSNILAWCESTARFARARGSFHHVFNKY